MRIGKRRTTLAVGDEKFFAVARNADGRRIPAHRDETQRATAPGYTNIEDGDVIHIRVGDEKQRFVR